MTTKNRAECFKAYPRDLSIWQNSIFPFLQSLLRIKYFSLEVEGLHLLPPKGPLVFAGNHSGWLTLDTLLFPYVLKEIFNPQRFPYAVVHDTLLKIPAIGNMIAKWGVIPSSWLRNPERFPREVETVGVYPEGDNGNFKPFWKAYHMQTWRTGFIRLALARKAKIVPCAIIGGEENTPVAYSFSGLKRFLGTKVPLPLSWLPFPTSWKFIFLRPIDLRKYPPDTYSNREACQEIAQNIQNKVQKILHEETKHRPLAILSNLFQSSEPAPGPTIRKTVPRGLWNN